MGVSEDRFDVDDAVGLFGWGDVGVGVGVTVGVGEGKAVGIGAFESGTAFAFGIVKKGVKFTFT